MLTRTFCHIPGVSTAMEKQLWLQGIHSWDAFHAQTRPVFSLTRNHAALLSLDESEKCLLQPDPGYFSKLLPARLHWRLFPSFRDGTAYLDIETSGLSRHRDIITTVALYDGKEVRYYIHGQNLADFREDVAKYQVLVTYNGKAFDIPFLEHYLDMSLPQSHIDLMHVLRSLGFKGGLKGCEKQLGLVREGLDGVDGSFAVRLWRDYAVNGNTKALETLLAYNMADAVNLETLMVEAYNLKLKETPFFDSLRLDLPKRRQLPFSPDYATIERLKQRSYP
ncbi:ribonuclease H-like domain-containing protein [Geotalea toluenoxydans]|uniref:ribonuclease H-like domain-containing protein n=1 Tax=Geotalea toluenoxydans TaxID=421624 RepID=UPI0006CFA959|nr:ribonuclease H-like domain-containing protein [Geotalea toluenoxydans]